MSYDETTRNSLTQDAQELVSRYPRPRSALLPMLHLVQSVDGYISPDGIAFCAESLGLAEPEVSAVATFYTQFKPQPNGTYNLGVCTTTLCAVLGGDAVFEHLSEYLNLADGQTSDDQMFTLERIQCNAACDYAPVVMVNWEFFDHQTPDTAVAMVKALQAGKPVRPTRGPDQVPTFREAERVLAGFSDGRADEGPGCGAPSRAGLDLAQSRGWSAPGKEAS